MKTQPKSPSRGPRHHLDSQSTEAVQPVPSWLRAMAANPRPDGSVEDAAFAAAVALTALDAVVRRQERWGGAWRQRLALTAAATTATRGGRIEDEAALRDALLLTRPGDDVGPAGRMYLAWRRVAAQPALELLRKRSLGAVLEEFGYAIDDEEIDDLADDVRHLSGTGMVAMLTGAVDAAEKHHFAPAGAAWIADALLAQRLGWTHAVPLLGGETAIGAVVVRRRQNDAAGKAADAETQANRAKKLLATQARAALRAIDLSAELARRAERLLVVAPQLRAKASDLVVDRLLSDDGIAASANIAGISDRGLRRLFDRLVDLGAVRELTGRPTFRVYGL